MYLLPYDDCYERKVRYKCKCGEKHIFTTYEPLYDDPYVEQTCKCGQYFKKVSRISLYGGEVLSVEKIR